MTSALRLSVLDQSVARAGRPRERALVGTGEQVRDRLLALADRWGVEEIAIVTWTWDPAAQRRSYELLARACGLN